MQENTGTSLLEAFSYEQIRVHLNKLRDAAFISAQAHANSTKTEILYPNPENDQACSACGVIKLAFEPPAIFCSSCSQKIKRNQVKHLFRCGTAHQESICLRPVQQKADGASNIMGQNEGFRSRMLMQK